MLPVKFDTWVQKWTWHSSRTSWRDSSLIQNHQEILSTKMVRAEMHHNDKDNNVNVIASVTIPALRQKIFQCNPFPNFWIKIPIISIVNTCINNSFYLCTTLHPKTTLKYYDNVLMNFKVYAEIKMGIACAILFFYQWKLLDYLVKITCAAGINYRCFQ